MRATFFRLAQRQPVGLHGRGHIGAVAHKIGESRKALDGAVVAHAVQRVLGVEGGPIGSAAELQQPIGAQAVLLVGASVGIQEGQDLGLAGGIQAVGQLPIRGPGLQHVTLELGQRSGQGTAVAPPVGLGHVQHSGVQSGVIRIGCGSRLRLQRRGEKRSAEQQRCGGKKSPTG